MLNNVRMHSVILSLESILFFSNNAFVLNNVDGQCIVLKYVRMHSVILSLESILFFSNNAFCYAEECQSNARAKECQTMHVLLECQWTMHPVLIQNA